MSAILASNAGDLANKMRIAAAGSDADLFVGRGTDGMGFRGTGRGGDGNGPYGRIHGLRDGLPDGNAIATAARLEKKATGPRGRISLGTGTSAGFCEAGQIAQVVRARAHAVRSCYEARLQVAPALAGKLTARWTIGLDGRVQSAAIVGDTLADGSVGDCVLRVVRRMAFAAPKGGVCVVQWPFAFSSGAR